MALVMCRPERVFEKELSKTDVKCRLAFPSRHIHHIISASSSNNGKQSSSVDFQVDDVDGRPFRLCLNIRSGRYRKPEVTRGWLKMVRSKGLKQHDKLIFYKNPDCRLHFTVAVKRAVRVFGVVIGHKAAEE